MTLAFPLTVDQFAGRFLVRDRGFELSEDRELSETGGADLLTADLGPRLWHGYYELKKQTHRDAEVIKGLIEALQYGSHAFHAFDHVLPGPTTDPQGVVTAGLNASVLAVNADNRHVSLIGMPAGFTLTEGDRFSIMSPSGAVALHRVLSSTVVAGGSGATPEFEVVPHVLPGVQVGDAVALFRSYFKARIVPGSFKKGRPRDLHVEGMRFDFIQQVK